MKLIIRQYVITLLSVTAFSQTNGPLLNVVYHVDSIILSMDETKVFVVDWQNKNPAIIDRVNGTKVSISFSSQLLQGFLTPYGAMFGTADSLFDWNSGTLDALGKYSAATLQVSGKYAVWNNNGNGYLRDLSAKSNVLINLGISVASNGVVGGTDAKYVYLYKSGVYDTLAYPEYQSSYVHVATDGKNLAYIKNTGCCAGSQAKIYLNTSQGIILLTDNGYLSTDLPRANFVKLYNGVTAYSKWTDLSFLQVWLRDSSGNSFQLTNMPAHCLVENLNDSGAVIFTANDKRYIILKGAGPQELSAANFGTTYYLNSTWYIAAGSDIHKINTENILPLNLQSFTATGFGKYNQLNWQTAQEVNTAKFDVEKSASGRNFTVIGGVNAAGNSTNAQAYRFTDANPLCPVNYYRLKMIDKDGRFTYSRIISVSNGEIVFKAAVLTNPAHNNITLQLTSGTAQKVQVSVISINGTVLLSQQLTVSAGTSIKTIAAGSLAKGTYFIKVSGIGLAQANLRIIKE